MRNPIQVVRENYQMAKEVVVETYQKDKSLYIFCAGSIVTSATSFAIIRYAQSKGFRYPMGTSYNPMQPVPGLLLSEMEIKHEIACGVLAAEFLKERNLTADMIDYTRKFIEETTPELLGGVKDDARVFSRISAITAKMA